MISEPHRLPNPLIPQIPSLGVDRANIMVMETQINVNIDIRASWAFLTE